MPSQTARTQKPPKSSKRARDNDPADEGPKNQNRRDPQHPPKPERRSKRLRSTTTDIEASPAPADAKVSSPTVDNRPLESKQKSGPKPGLKFPTEAESPPPWSWDITGEWTLTCPQLTNGHEFKTSDTLMMTIHLANNPRHTKVGRQYWATFDFGDGSFIGNMRFCPYVDSGRGNISMKDFEKACVLKERVWVGPNPHGMQKWNLRWRGVMNTGVVEDHCCDQYQSDIEFKKGDDGKLTLGAVFVFRFQPMVLRGVKTGEAKPPGGRDASVASQWLQYKPRYI